jgi:hypothetical protein
MAPGSGADATWVELAVRDSAAVRSPGGAEATAGVDTSSGAWDGDTSHDSVDGVAADPVADERAPFLHRALAPRKGEEGGSAGRAARGEGDPAGRAGLVRRASWALGMLLRSGLARQLAVTGLLFFLAWLMFSVLLLPIMSEDDRKRLRVPESLQQVQEMYSLLGEYKDKNYFAILCGFSVTYLIKQALALPGSPLFNLLGGGLFGVAVGFPVCLACTGVGTAMCYAFYSTFGGPVVRRRPAPPRPRRPRPGRPRGARGAARWHAMGQRRRNWCGGAATRRVQLVRRDGRDVSTLYGREGGGGGGTGVGGRRQRAPPRRRAGDSAPRPRPCLRSGCVTHAAGAAGFSWSSSWHSTRPCATTDAASSTISQVRPTPRTRRVRLVRGEGRGVST